MEKKNVRSSVKAIIIEDGRLLAIKKKDKTGFFYILPGGGQEHGETLHEALVRECKEEISVTVEPVKLLLVRDYIASNHGFVPDILHNLHQLDLMFLCRIKEGIPHNGSETDDGQICPEWLNLSDIENCRIYPAAIKSHLLNPDETADIYMGDVN